MIPALPGKVTIDVPWPHPNRKSRVINVGKDSDGYLCIWLEAYQNCVMNQQRIFTIHYTGDMIPGNEEHIGSYVDPDGVGLVYHIFEIGG